jgi:hypothetical protein
MLLIGPALLDTKPTALPATATCVEPSSPHHDNNRIATVEMAVSNCHLATIRTDRQWGRNQTARRCRLAAACAAAPAAAVALHYAEVLQPAPRPIVGGPALVSTSHQHGTPCGAPCVAEKGFDPRFISKCVHGGCPQQSEASSLLRRPYGSLATGAHGPLCVLRQGPLMGAPSLLPVCCSF